jgi:hypothetical protein
MATTFEFRTLTATLVFDLTDSFAMSRGTRGPFPRPFEPIRVFAIARIIGLIREEINPPLELIVQRNGNGYHIFHNSTKRPDGTVSRKALADGRYDFRIEGDFYQPVVRTNVDLPAPRTALTATLLPAYNYPFPLDLKPTGGRGFALLRGSLHTREGAPISGATVSSVGANSNYITGNGGQWVLVFPDGTFPAGITTTNVTVVVTPASGPAINVLNVAIDKGTERSLSETSFRGWVLARGTGVAGAVVEVQGQPGNTVTGPDGSWFYYFGLDHSAVISVAVTAQLPDGRTLTQINQQVQPRATVIVPPFAFP